MTVDTDPTQSVPWAALAPIAVLAVAFAGYCLFDLSRSEVRYLPKWAWAILCLGIGLTIPFGGILYLVIGKDRSPKSSLVPELSSAS